MPNYKKPIFWIIISAVIAAGAVSIGLIADEWNNSPKNSNPALNNQSTVISADGLNNITTVIDRTNLDACVTDAIITANSGRHHNGDFAAEAHTVFKIAEDGSTTTVFGIALYLEFKYDDNTFYETGGSHMPIAATFKKNANDTYELVEYWRPSAGSNFAPSIKSKFPSDIYENAIDTQNYVVAHVHACYEKAIEYSKVNIDAEIARLIETIISSPAQMSNPQAYINEHIGEYRKLTYCSKYTLRYCFNQFEKGDMTNLTGHIMAAACRDILGNEDIDILVNNGQEWYNAYKKHVVNLSEKYGKDYMSENLPGSWTLLQMLDTTSN